MRPSNAVVPLCVLIALLALPAAGAGLFWPGGDGTETFTSVRGETVPLYGHGLYQFDSRFAAAGYQGQDAVTLFLGISLLLLTAWFYRRGSRRAGLLLTGALAFFLYVYASMALGAAYNPLFLVYVALFGLSLFALALAFGSIQLDDASGLPRRGPATFLFAAGAVTLLVWLEPLLTAISAGRAPALLGHDTTLVTDALDLAVITPATFWAGALVWRRDPLGYRLAFPLLGIIALLLPTIALATVFQVRAGVVFSTGEIVGPITGFLVLGLLALWVMAAILRRLPQG